MDKAAMFAILDANIQVETNVRSKWSRYDVAFRLGLDNDEAARILFDYFATRVLVTAANLSDVSHEGARKLLPDTDYMQGMPTMHAVWDAKPDLLMAELEAGAAKKARPSLAERHEQAARASDLLMVELEAEAAKKAKLTEAERHEQAAPVIEKMEG
jgi:hypothetical protein